MRKPQIRNIIPHYVQEARTQSISAKIADLHVQVIENRFNQSGLTTAQQLTVIDLIIEKLNADETQRRND